MTQKPPRPARSQQEAGGKVTWAQWPELFWGVWVSSQETRLQPGANTEEFSVLILSRKDTIRGHRPSAPKDRSPRGSRADDVKKQKSTCTLVEKDARRVAGGVSHAKRFAFREEGPRATRVHCGAAERTSTGSRDPVQGWGQPRPWRGRQGPHSWPGRGGRGQGLDRFRALGGCGLLPDPSYRPDIWMDKGLSPEPPLPEGVFLESEDL